MTGVGTDTTARYSGSAVPHFPAEGDITMVGDVSEPNRAYGVCREQVTIDGMKPHVGSYACGMHRHYHDNLGAM